QISQSRRLFEPSKRIGGEWDSPDKGALKAFQKRYQGVLSGDSPLDYSIPSHSVHYRPYSFIGFDTPLALFELRQLDNARLKFELRDLRQASAMVRHAILKHFKQPSFLNYYGK